MVDFKERLQQLRWIGHGCDSELELARLYDYWLVNHNAELMDPNTSASSVIPPPRMHVSLIVSVAGVISLGARKPDPRQQPLIHTCCGVGGRNEGICQISKN